MTGVSRRVQDALDGCKGAREDLHLKPRSPRDNDDDAEDDAGAVVIGSAQRTPNDNLSLNPMRRAT